MEVNNHFAYFCPQHWQGLGNLFILLTSQNNKGIYFFRLKINTMVKCRNHSNCYHYVGVECLFLNAVTGCLAWLYNIFIKNWSTFDLIFVVVVRFLHVENFCERWHKDQLMGLHTLLYDFRNMSGKCIVLLHLKI